MTHTNNPYIEKADAQLKKLKAQTLIFQARVQDSVANARIQNDMDHVTKQYNELKKAGVDTIKEIQQKFNDAVIKARANLEALDRNL